MSPRLLENTKWICCLLVLSGWRPVGSVSVKSPPKGPATVEAQAKFFQYRHLPTSEDFDQGHRQGSEKHFTERHERSRPGEGLYSAKVRWGDKQGGYGEHYWDLNHAGHTDNYGHDDDDGSYHSGENNDPYDEPSEQLPTYNDEYDAEKSAQSPFDESNRAKRAHAKVKTDKKTLDDAKARRNTRDEYKTTTEEPKNEETEVLKYEPAKLNNYKPKELNYDEDQQNPNQPDQAPKAAQPEPRYQPHLPGYDTRYPNQPDQAPKAAQQEPRYQPHLTGHDTRYPNQPDQAPKAAQQEPRYQPHLTGHDTRYPNQPDQALKAAQPEPRYQPHWTGHNTRYVPYEGGAGVRQYRQPEAAASSTPRLFLEPSTGHVVDRATGQAYILQPITFDYN